MPKEPVEFVVPEVPWDKTEMQYSIVPATDEDGNPINPAGKSASGDKRGAAADHKEK
jgi:hypothetical protein